MVLIPKPGGTEEEELCRIAQVDDFVKERRVFGMVIEVPPPAPEMGKRALLRDWMRRREDELRRTCVATALVLPEGAAARFFLSMMLLVTRRRLNYKVVRSVAEGITWCQNEVLQRLPDSRR